MASGYEKLLEEFETFEADLEVEEILSKVKAELLLDKGVTEFGEQLKQRESEKQAAQIEREALVEEQWSPGCYPQLNTDWFIEGLDYCCSYWRYQFKRPLTPPPPPPPSPDAPRKTRQTMLPLHVPPTPYHDDDDDVPTKRRRR